MDARTRRIAGPARVGALALIALVVAGLGYLRLAPDAGRPSVPAAAHAGQLVLKPCHYGTEQGSYAADCGTLVVPENRADARSRLIALPVTRIHARAEHPAAPIFRLEGGPGISNMHFADASRFAATHDVVLVGYRGVDGSSVLDCPQVESALRHSADYLGESSFRAYAAGFRACARDLRTHGVDLAGYTLPQRVDDLEAARRALSYGPIDLISESAGTRTAMIYSWRYPASIHRSVMIGANPPGNFLWKASTINGQIGHYSALCAADAGCRTRTGDLAASMRTTNTRIPDRWLFLPIKKGNVRIASFYGLMESMSGGGPLSAPLTLDAWLSAARGDPSGFWLQSLMADLTFPASFVWGDVAAASRADARAAGDSFASDRNAGSIIGNPGTDFLWAGGLLRNAWPGNPGEHEYARMRDSNVETLVIGGNLDFATPARNATIELMPHLPHAHQVVLSDLGHTNDFWTYQPQASSRLVNAFLDTGKVDRSLYTRHTVDLAPSMAMTGIAKIALATMLGFAALTVCSLLWMRGRVRRRGAVGRRSSAVLRSLHPLVLGLGGWSVGALIVLTSMPTVPLDNELLAALSIGLPIGLGIYWAWVHRDWSSSARAVGLGAALGGGLIGGWLGFNATTGPLALVTTIIGAGAGGNLAVIFLDVARDRSARDRATFVAPAPVTERPRVEARA
jgi:pimeloyl-ACP methyl ester carboxylesterase